MSLLKEHYSPKPLILTVRFRFHKRNQQDGESISQFVAVLKRLSEHCEFGQSLSDTICDRFVCGLRSEAIQKRLLTESNLTLQKAIKISTSMEMAAKEAQQLSASDQVHKVYSDARNKSNSEKACYRCRKVGHQPVDCWFKDMNYRNCGKKGHIECACKNKRHNQVKTRDLQRNIIKNSNKSMQIKCKTPNKHRVIRKQRTRMLYMFYLFQEMNEVTGWVLFWTENQYVCRWTQELRFHCCHRQHLKKCFHIAPPSPPTSHWRPILVR